MDILVSVLMTVYNREKYIAEAIESVLASTYQNFELIIVDDCSTDRSFEIAQQYAALDNRIQIYRNEKNLKDYPNRNRAASYATGKYIKYLDSDDIIYPWGLQVMVEAMERFPDAAFAIPGTPNEREPFPIYCSGKEALVAHYIKGAIFIHGPSAIIFRRDAFESVSFFGTKTFVGSDMEVQLKLASEFDFLKIQPALIWWREHENQEIKKGTENYSYFIDGFKSNYEFLVNFSHFFDKTQKRIAIKKMRNLYLGKFIRFLTKLETRPIYLFFKANKEFFPFIFFGRLN